MKPNPKPLDRLLRAAAAVPQPAPGELPFAVEARVLASWRARPAADDIWMLLPIFRRGLLAACALMVVALALSVQQWNRPDQTEEWEVPALVVNVALSR